MRHDDDELEAAGRRVTIWALLIMFALSTAILTLLITQIGR